MRSFYDDDPLDYDDYDPRTYTEKVYDDNTWSKNRGIAKDLDGNPAEYWCDVCKKWVYVFEVESSTVFDRDYNWYCVECKSHETHLHDEEPEDSNE